MASKDEVQELAQKLNDWAQKKLKPEEQTLLHWLLSRGVYKEEQEGEKVRGTAAYVFTKDIKQAVKDALRPLTKINLPDPGDGWARAWGGWARMGDWARDGYWALGMGRPPKLGKMPPWDPDPIRPEDPGPIPSGGPGTPPA